MKSLKAVLLGLLTVGAFSAQAEYLLWQMDWEDTANTADYATLVVMDASGNELAPPVALELANLPTEVTGDDRTKVFRDYDSSSASGYSNEPQQVTSVIDSQYANDNYTFALRTYDANDTVLKTYTPAPYSALSDSIWGGSLTPGVSTAWSPTKYAVPEPATGTLFILGSLMLFRRKRA